jgi:hypothetical protein
MSEHEILPNIGAAERRKPKEIDVRDCLLRIGKRTQLHTLKLGLGKSRAFYLVTKGKNVDSIIQVLKNS